MSMAMAGRARHPVGLTALDPLRAATSVAAKVCGIPDTGRLASGNRAELLAVGGNPLDRIEDLDNVQLVVAAGRVLVNER
jgi:imidazolonepropionase-like amidohydrolase